MDLLLNVMKETCANWTWGEDDRQFPMRSKVDLNLFEFGMSKKVCAWQKAYSSVSRTDTVEESNRLHATVLTTRII